MNRIDRLTAILIHLQTKRVVRAVEIATRFKISERTVYRDVKALMEAGVPIGSEAGTGYFIVDGFHLPPVMFSQDEAGALLLAGKLVDKMADKSVRVAFESALYKIKSVLQDAAKDHLESLDSHIEVVLRSKYEPRDEKKFPDHFLINIQQAISKHQVLKLDYSDADNKVTAREVEPVGIYYYSLSWHLIGWCRLRNGFRDFRSDRISSLANTGEIFKERSLLSMDHYFQSVMQSNKDLTHVVVAFEKSALRRNPVYGCVKQTDLGKQVRVEFMMDDLNYIAHWLLTFGTAASVEGPDQLKDLMAQITQSLHEHYAKL
jgi:predicted DNA-binding transcriptional regulator YafY